MIPFHPQPSASQGKRTRWFSFDTTDVKVESRSNAIGGILRYGSYCLGLCIAMQLEDHYQFGPAPSADHAYFGNHSPKIANCEIRSSLSFSHTNKGERNTYKGKRHTTIISTTAKAASHKLAVPYSAAAHYFSSQSPSCDRLFLRYYMYFKCEMLL